MVRVRVGKTMEGMEKINHIKFMQKTDGLFVSIAFRREWKIVYLLWKWKGWLRVGGESQIDHEKGCFVIWFHWCFHFLENIFHSWASSWSIERGAQESNKYSRVLIIQLLCHDPTLYQIILMPSVLNCIGSVCFTSSWVSQRKRKTFSPSKRSAFEVIEFQSGLEKNQDEEFERSLRDLWWRGKYFRRKLRSLGL